MQVDGYIKSGKIRINIQCCLIIGFQLDLGPSWVQNNWIWWVYTREDLPYISTKMECNSFV